MLTWSPSFESLVAIRPFVCEKKRFAQKFTDRRTDRQTDDGRLAIVLAHSWNELKMVAGRHLEMLECYRKSYRQPKALAVSTPSYC